jgi:hypothetical protein
MRISITHTVVLALLTASACTLVGSAGARSFIDPPRITAFAPNHGLPGARITIYGHNFTSATVDFGLIPATEFTMDANATHIYVKVPSDLSEGWTGRITVTTPGGTATTAADFTAVPKKVTPRSNKPVIRSVSPLRARVGDEVMIKGSNLGGTRWVRLGGVRAVFTVPKTTLVIAHVPKNAHSGPIKISLKTGSGVVTKWVRFAVLAPR